MSARHRIPGSSPAGRAAAEALRRDVAGEVWTSPLRRWLYSTDASDYRIVPEVVLVAASPDDLAAAAAVSAETGLPVVARGAASSLAGQAIGPGIVVDCFKLDRILAIDGDARTARVQPGVVQAALNAAAAPHGLEFGPDTSTVDQATIGGMVGNNSSGSRSIVYGESKDKVVRVDGVLAGGEAMTFGACAGGDLAAGARGPAGERLAAALAQVRERYREPIATGFPQTRRCTSGYNLRELLAPEPNLGRLLAGSEGTLALFTELEVQLDPRPARRAGAALTFATLRAGLEANLAILETGPSAVEFLDLAPLRRSPNVATFRRMAGLLAGDEEAMLTVEYQGSEEEALAGLARLRARAGELGAVQVVWLEQPADLAEAAALRRSVLPLLMGAPGAERPAAFVEDTAVAPERLADFVADLQRVVAAHGARASFTGHASAGCLHLRPLLDLKTAAGVARQEALATRRRPPRHGVPRRDLRRARLRALAELVPPAAPRPAALRGDGGRQGRVRPAAPAQSRRRRGWTAGLGVTPVRRRLPRRPRLDAAPVLRRRGRLRPGRGEVLRGRALQEAHRHDVPAGHRDARRGAHHAGARQRPAGSGLRRRAPRGHRGGRVPGGARHVRRLQGVQDGVPGRGGHGRAQGRVARGGPGARGRASARPGDRRLPPARGPRRPGRAAGERARAHPPGARAGEAGRRGPGAAAAAVRAAAAHASPVAGAARASGGGRRRRPAAALFVDCFIQYQEPRIGEALARLLAAAGLPLAAADAGCCGRTALSTGQIEKARDHALRALDGLYPLVSAGAEILFVEPSCLSMVRDDWARLLPHDHRVAEVAAASRPALELVAGLAAEGRLRFRAGGRALLHSHCHEKALGFAAATAAALAAVPGLAVEDPDAGCCGMSGVFGYEARHYELSVAMAERALLPAVRAASPDTVVLATGTSCRTQIGDLGGRTALHPLEFLAARLQP